MPSLVDRLNNLGIKKANEITPIKKKEKVSLIDLLDATLIENQFGNTIVVEKTYPFGYQHGNVQFTEVVDIQTIHKAGKLNFDIDNLKKLVFLDTETTGLAGGTGTLAFLVGVARFDEFGLRLTQFIVENPADEPAMLLALSNYGEDIEAVVTFNGKSFDMPLLKTRYLLNRMPVPFLDWGHLDLLHLSRRIWRQRLTSRSLKDLETEILHVPRSEDEVPGWMIPEIYFNYLRTEDPSQIANVVYHNAMDIVSLAALYLEINRMVDKDLFSSQMHGSDVYAIGQLYENIGENNKAATIYEHCLATKNLADPQKIDLTNKLAILYKKQSIWEKAVSYWLKNANSGDFDSCIELAKYYEHEKKDPRIALEWTEQADLCLEKMELTRIRKKSFKKDLLLRKERLEKRVNNV